MIAAKQARAISSQDAIERWLEAEIIKAANRGLYSVEITTAEFRKTFGHIASATDIAIRACRNSGYDIESCNTYLSVYDDHWERVPPDSTRRAQRFRVTWQ